MLKTGLSLFIQNEKEIEALAAMPGQSSLQLLLAVEGHSLIGTLNWAQICSLTTLAKEKGFKSVLVVDKLFSEKDLQQLCSELSALDSSFWHAIDSIRFQDAGLANLFLLFGKKYQIDLQVGHRNWPSIQAWIDLFPGLIEQVILSHEIPKEQLFQFAQRLNSQGITNEILGAGPPLLFYTPRPLLSAAPLRPVYYSATSEESPHKGFPVYQNNSGTFMFHLKSLWLLDWHTEIKNGGVDFLRVEFFSFEWFADAAKKFEWCFHPDVGVLTAIGQNENGQGLERAKQLFEEYSQLLCNRGLFQSNRTDVLFPKLKNTRLQNKGPNYIGQICDVDKEAHKMLIRLPKRMDKIFDSDVAQFQIVTPEGKIKKAVLHASDFSLSEDGQLWFVPLVKGVSTKSMVYLT